MARSHILTLSLLAAVGLFGQTPRAAAEDGTMRAYGERSEVTGPNRAMMRSGLWTLGLSYVPAVVVAIESSEPADDHLYLPVAGPWLDYAERDCRTCAHESLNKVLLVGDGILQGIGALQIVGSFFFMETRVTSTARRRTPAEASATQLRILPAKVGRSFGIAASARF